MQLVARRFANLESLRANDLLLSEPSAMTTEKLTKRPGPSGDLATVEYSEESLKIARRLRPKYRLKPPQEKRMRELVERRDDGRLTATERRELDRRFVPQSFLIRVCGLVSRRLSPQPRIS